MRRRRPRVVTELVVDFCVEQVIRAIAQRLDGNRQDDFENRLFGVSKLTVTVPSDARPTERALETAEENSTGTQTQLARIAVQKTCKRRYATPSNE
jgi:hypothetical protein